MSPAEAAAVLKLQRELALVQQALGEAWHYREDPNAATPAWDTIGAAFRPPPNRPVAAADLDEVLEPRQRRRVVDVPSRPGR